MNIINVGLGTLSTGPITNTGTIPLVEVEGHWIAATNHASSTVARIPKDLIIVGMAFSLQKHLEEILILLELKII